MSKRFDDMSKRFDDLSKRMDRIENRLDSMQAAVLLAKLAVFEEELAARERVACYYDSRLGDVVRIPARVPESASAWAIYAILLPDSAARDGLQAGLKERGVPTAIYYPRPLHLQPAYRKHHDGSALPVSEDLASRILALPIHADLTDAALAHVCESVLAAAGRG